MKKLFCILALLFVSHGAALSDTKSIDQIIDQLDTKLFEHGFNQCDATALNEVISEKFEFFHDQAGVIENKNQFIRSILEGTCKLNYKPKRVLIQNTVENFPLNKNGHLYGILQSGVHQFFAIGKNGSERLTSNAKFQNLWQLENGHWKLSRAYSFAHQEQAFATRELISFTKIRTMINAAKIPATGIAYIQNGLINDIRVAGELQKDRPAPMNTLWNVASLTKPVTALLALKLINQGQWNLDEPLYHYVNEPDLKNDSRHKLITTRMVLSHTTGFPNWRHNSTDGKLKIEFQPGSRYQYSGEGFDYLRRALEKKWNTSINALAQKVLFNPLGMTSTSYVWSKTTDESRFALWHKSDGTLHELERQSKANGADNLITTVSDYAVFVNHLLHGAGLSPQLYAELVKPQITVGKNKQFGLGWCIDQNINAKADFALVHSGEDIGVRTIAFLLPQTKTALIIFTNADTGTQIYKDLLLHYLGNEGAGIFRVETQSD